MNMRASLTATVVLALMLYLSIAVTYGQADAPGPLKVGIATVDITPAGSVYMAGLRRNSGSRRSR